MLVINSYLFSSGPTNPGTTGQLLLNPSFDTNSSGGSGSSAFAQHWTNTGANPGNNYLTRETSNARTGVASMRYIYSNHSAAWAYQDVSVAAYADDIDAEFATIDAGLWGQNTNAGDGDYARAQVRFLDGVGATIGSDALGNHVASTSYTQSQITGSAVPIGTRTLRYFAYLARVSGTSIHCRCDDAGLTMTIA